VQIADSCPLGSLSYLDNVINKNPPFTQIGLICRSCVSRNQKKRFIFSKKVKNSARLPIEKAGMEFAFISIMGAVDIHACLAKLRAALLRTLFLSTCLFVAFNFVPSRAANPLKSIISAPKNITKCWATLREVVARIPGATANRDGIEKMKTALDNFTKWQLKTKSNRNWKWLPLREVKGSTSSQIARGALASRIENLQWDLKTGPKTTESGAIEGTLNIAYFAELPAQATNLLSDIQQTRVKMDGALGSDLTNYLSLFASGFGIYALTQSIPTLKFTPLTPLSLLIGMGVLQIETLPRHFAGLDYNQIIFGNKLEEFLRRKDENSDWLYVADDFRVQRSSTHFLLSRGMMTGEILGNAYRGHVFGYSVMPFQYLFSPLIWINSKLKHRMDKEVAQANPEESQPGSSPSFLDILRSIHDPRITIKTDWLLSRSADGSAELGVVIRIPVGRKIKRPTKVKDEKQEQSIWQFFAQGESSQ
jgi:hypothetical protein